MAADAESLGQKYVDRMNKSVWPLVREYWFDALIVVGAISTPRTAWWLRDRVQAVVFAYGSGLVQGS